MDFAIAPATQALLADVRAFLAARVLPHDAAWLATPWADLQPTLDALRAEVRARGWWAPTLGPAWGGMGLALPDFALLGEELGRSPFGHYLFGCQAPDAGNMEILAEFGTPAQQQAWLAPMAAGRLRGCFAMTEPDTPGSNPTQLACRAVRDGDGWVLTGRKWFATGADGAAVALAMAVTDPDAPPHRRATIFVVPTDAPGYQLVRNVPVMGHAGGGWLSHAELRFDGVRVGADAVLGAPGEGFAIAQARLGPGRIHHCMRWIGVAERAFAMLATRANARAIEPDASLADQALTRAAAAELRARLDAARLLVLHAAWKIEHAGYKAARVEISLIKPHVAAVLTAVVDRAVQVHGALGLTSDTVLAWFYAHERGARIYDGADEVHLLSAGKQILRAYADPA